MAIAPENRRQHSAPMKVSMNQSNDLWPHKINVPATFLRLMDSVLVGLQWKRCLVYLDDIIICGRTFEEHLSNLRAVIECLKQAGLKLQPTKCALARK